MFSSDVYNFNLSSGLWRQDYENQGKVEIHEHIFLFGLPEVDKMPQAGSLSPPFTPPQQQLTGCFGYQSTFKEAELLILQLKHFTMKAASR